MRSSTSSTACAWRSGKGDAPEHAIRRARVLVGPAIILTTIVLAFGLGVTVLLRPAVAADVRPRVRLSRLLASLIADLVFLPATIMVGRRLWPHRARRRRT